MTTYKTERDLGQDRQTDTFSVYRTTRHDGWRRVFTARGAKARERADHVRELFQRERSCDDERFLQRLLAGDAGADAELRVIVGAQPRSTHRGGRFASPFA
jgi:hypothetical protein